MKIDFLLGENPYGTTHHFAKGFTKALKRAGASVRLLSLQGQEARSTFNKIHRHPPDLTCSFSDITLGDKPLGEVLQIPHLSLLIDPVIYFLHQLTTPFSLISSVDQGNVAFLKALGLKNAFFLPHGVPKEVFDAPQSKERPYDIVYIGTCIDIEGIEQRWEAQYPKKVRDLFKRACHRILSVERVTIIEALADEGVDSFDLPAYHHEVDFYVRGKDRIELLRSLSGLKIDLFGGQMGQRGWSYYLDSFLNCRVHDAVDFDKSLTILRQAKVALNSVPSFKNGSHERIFYSIACGAIPLTSKSSYLLKEFSDSKYFLTYDFGAYDQALSKLDALLHAPDKQKAMIESATSLVLCHHTFDSRAETLLSNSTVQAMVGR